MTREVRVGVLASGRGSNFEALATALNTRSLAMSASSSEHTSFSESSARVVCLGTDNPKAGALQIAERLGIAHFVVNETAKQGRLQASNEQEVCDFLRQHQVDLICLAGFMRIVRGPLLAHYKRAILNIHPSLLPSFPGLHGPQQALEHGVQVTGCTVHFVDAGIDTGPILLQAAVPIVEGDNVSTLTDRIQTEEHRIYPQAVRLWSSGRVQVDEGRVILLPPTTPEPGTSLTAGKEETS